MGRVDVSGLSHRCPPITCLLHPDRARLLGLHDQPDLAHAEPDTLRYRLLHLPARLAAHARRRFLSISATRTWADAFALYRERLTRLPATWPSDLYTYQQKDRPENPETSRAHPDWTKRSS